MSLLTHLISLKEGEHILRVMRRNFSILFLPIFLALGILWLLLLSLFSLFQLGNFGSVLFFFLLGLALLYILRAAFVWYYNVIIVTNFRLIIVEQSHLLRRHKKEIFLNHIEKVFLCPPRFFERLFFERTFEFTFKTTKKVFKLRRIRNFAKMKIFFDALIREQKNINPDKKAHTLQFPLESPEILIHTLSEEEAEEITKECLELLFLLRGRMGKEKFIEIFSRKKI